MKRLCKILSLVLIFVFVFSTVLFAREDAPNTHFITEREANNQTFQAIPTEGYLPLVRRGSPNAMAINDEIDRIQNDAMALARRSRALSIYFSYDVVIGGAEDQYVSIIVGSETAIASTLQRVDTIVISQETREILTLTDILGRNAVAIVTSVVEEYIANNSGFYTNVRLEISEDHNFYIEGEMLYIIFNKYEIADGSMGIQKIGIELSNVINLTLEREEYHLSGLYGIRMVPLRLIAEAFGHRISWNEASETATITRNGTTNGTVSITIGSNRYTRITSRSTPFETRLEMAPELIDGSAHVPITFIDVMLGLIYSIDPSGEITISEYRR
ncbi:MAG: stalk domain-containing protein [Defluviitaleaceae bacterium]|nr:stalk domain-containing protein [Defluviitaleaceae bacterium]